MQDKKISGTRILFWLIAILVVLFLIVAFISDKKAEKLRLEEYKKQLEKDEAEILLLKEKNEKLFNRAYLVLKLIFLGIITAIVGITIHFTNSSNFFDYLSNCTTVFGAIGTIAIVACVVFEQNPLDIFKARTFFKNFIFDLINDPHKEIYEKLPFIKEQKEETDNKILEIEKAIKSIDVFANKESED